MTGRRQAGWASALFLPPLLLAACNSEPATVGGVTPEEAAALNNAAEMLDASPDSMAAPSEEPAAAVNAAR